MLTRFNSIRVELKKMIKRVAKRRTLRHARAQAIACAGYAFRLEAGRVTRIYLYASWPWSK